MTLRRQPRWMVPLGVLVAVQGLLAGVYVLVDSRRGERARPRGASELTEQAPELDLVRADGEQLALSSLRGRHVLVHFWATWCEPCRRELPTLLALADDAALRERVTLVAVSVDEDWPAIRAYFDGRPPAAVARAAGRSPHAKYGASTLPDTYLVAPDGALVGRFEGARDWTRSEVRKDLETLMDTRSRKN